MPHIPEPNFYQPYLSPLFLPASRLWFSCRFPRAVRLPYSPSATPGTLVNGCFRSLLLAHACRESRLFGSEDIDALRDMITRQDFASACTAREFQCAHPDACACGDLHRLRCSWQPGRVLPPVVRLSAPALWEEDAIVSWELEVTLLGRKPQRHLALVERLVRLMGAVGLRIGEETVPFTVEGPVETLSGCIGGEWNPFPETRGMPPDAIYVPEGVTRVLVELATPLLLKPASRGKEASRAPGPDSDLHPAKLLGNLAFDLCALDMEDRGEDAPPVSRRRILCEEARATVQMVALNTHVLAVQLAHSRHGARLSRTNKREINLRGFFGHIVLKCLPDTLPWLRALGHWRAGQLAAKGFGEIRLWYRY